MSDVPGPGAAAPARSLSATVEATKEFVGARWSALSPSRKAISLGVLGACGLVAVLLLWWVSRPNWRVLYTGLTAENARQLGSVLTAANLTYDVSPDGATLRVPAESLDKARLATAGKAGGKAGRIGFELFDKPDWSGSDFEEKVNYQRALEGELEHTIDTLGDVQSSRVHLVLPHDSLFAESQRDAKASVVLTLKTRQLGGDEAESIKNLVASAVDDLSPDRVVLMDAQGHGLLGVNSASSTRAAYEQTLAEHILETLEPVVGTGNVRATVNVDYDLASRDEVDENYDPGSVVTLSMQRAEQTSGGQPPAQGVPGTASNAPNQQAPLFPAAKPDGASSKQESGTYGASKKTRHLMEGPGDVRRITAAILINDRLVAGTDKKKTWQPWSADEVKQITALSQAAVGFEAARGDTVVVQNLRFDPAPEVGAGVVQKLLRQADGVEPFLKDGLMLLIAAAALLLIVRPAMRVFAQQAVPVRQLAASAARSDAELPGGRPVFEQAPGVFDEVVEQIERDPAQSARVLQTWIRAD